MSALCKPYCPNFTGCETRLAAAVGEGVIIDAQEQARIASQKTLPEREADLVLRVVQLENDQIFGELDESSWVPGATESVPTTMLRRAADEQADIEKAYRINAFELADIERRQTRNTEDVTQLAAGMDEITEAAAGCGGPGLDVLGKVLQQRDRLLGRTTLPEYYLLEHAVCASETAGEVYDRMPVPEQLYVPSGAIGTPQKTTL